ncbi:MAG: hypothetical protein QM783_02270 [Phycisphaerales bacterium]
MNRCCLAALAAALSCSIAPLSSCQSGGMSSLLGKDAMSLLAPYLKDAANSYLTNINALVSSLENVHSLTDAVNVAPKIEPAAKDAGKAYKTLAAATPDERKLLWEAFGPKFDATNSGFLKQADRVKSNSLWGQALRVATDEVKLFSRDGAAK